VGTVEDAGGSRPIRRVFRAAAFAVSASIGFVVAEALIVAGLYVLFGQLELPGNMSSSPTLLALDVFALATGVAVSFAINERTTVKGAQWKTNETRMLLRLWRFEGVSAIGNLVIIVVQLVLLAEFGLSPAIGSVIGAVVGFPVSYLMSMRLVWRIRV
jgi:putative flippase GtrA